MLGSLGTSGSQTLTKLRAECCATHMKDETPRPGEDVSEEEVDPGSADQLARRALWLGEESIAAVLGKV